MKGPDSGQREALCNQSPFVLKRCSVTCRDAITEVQPLLRWDEPHPTRSPSQTSLEALNPGVRAVAPSIHCPLSSIAGSTQDLVLASSPAKCLSSLASGTSWW